MTEPDEALIWARLQNGNPAKPRTITDNYRAGLMAHGYRAGQAASAERIKALEEALRPLAECEITEPDVPIPDDYGGRYFITYGEIRRARNLLKEAAQ
jgi:hypothetical protein